VGSLPGAAKRIASQRICLISRTNKYIHTYHMHEHVPRVLTCVNPASKAKHRRCNHLYLYSYDPLCHILLNLRLPCHTLLSPIEIVLTLQLRGRSCFTRGFCFSLVTCLHGWSQGVGRVGHGPLQNLEKLLILAL
jgi:hypothetical protein